MFKELEYIVNQTLKNILVHNIICKINTSQLESILLLFTLSLRLVDILILIWMFASFFLAFKRVVLILDICLQHLLQKVVTFYIPTIFTFELMDVWTSWLCAILTKFTSLMDVKAAVSMLTVGEIFALTKLIKKDGNL